MFEFLSLYGLLALTHLFNQINFCHRDYLNSIKNTLLHHQDTLEKAPHIPLRVAVVIPTYNETTAGLQECVKSALHQSYSAGIIVIVIDDGSKDKQAINHIKRVYADQDNLFVFDTNQNQGKRHAQKIGFDMAEEYADILVTIDSDTILERDSIHHLVQQFDDQTVGATTGNVRAKQSNMLSKLIDARYWTAFNQERAAQSLFGTVLCCSGPLAAYRTSIIKKVKDKYISQRFLGQWCTYGDDRHLTNLVLEQGYQVKYQRKAKAFTEVPTKLAPWLRQQTRWNRSFYRESLWTFKQVISKGNHQSIYMIYDLFMQAILPILLITSLLLVFMNSLMEGPIHLFGYLSILVGIALIRGFYAFLRTREKVFFLFPCYAFCHIFLLIPVRIYALFTLKTTIWGTR